MLAVFSPLFVAFRVYKPVSALTLIAVNGVLKSWKRGLPAATLSGRMSSLLLAVLFCAGGVAAQDGYWTSSSGGSWASAGNWDPANGIAAGTDSTAYFGFGREAAITANASFTLDGAQTIGNLCFTTQGGPANWNFSAGSGGSLTLDNDFGPAEITVTSPTLQVSLNVIVAGDAGVEKDGPGTLVLAAQNTYSGLNAGKRGRIERDRVDRNGRRDS